MFVLFRSAYEIAKKYDLPIEVRREIQKLTAAAFIAGLLLGAVLFYAI